MKETKKKCLLQRLKALVSSSPTKPEEAELIDLKYTIGELSITLNDPRTNEIHTIHTNNGSFEDIKMALKKGHFYTAIALIQANKILNEIVHGNIVLNEGKVYLDGVEYNSDVTDAIIQAVDNGSNYQSLIKFLEKVLQNPSIDSQNRLFAFMNTIDLPLAEDGDIYAYKRVNADLTDVHTGTFSNHIGNIVTMPRANVVEDPKKTCSAGLHFCSQSYLGHFGGACVVKLKIHPKDVVSIPVDYKNAKGRCCRYEVVELLNGKPSRENIHESA